MIPFSKELDEICRGDRPIALKLFSGATVAAFAALDAFLRGNLAGEVSLACFLVITLIVGPAAVIYLSLVDGVRSRLAVGERVGWLRCIYFSGDLASLAVWVVTIMFVGTPTVILLLGLLGL
jgi:hypothetical protein